MLKRKLIIYFFIGLVFLFCATPSARADFDGLRQEYLDKLSKYNEAYSQFLIAKNTYQTYKTLASLTQAIENAKSYLKVRDELIIKHFELLLARLDEINFTSLIISDAQKKIAQDEITFYTNHLGLIPAIATLKEVNASADQAQTQIPSSNLKSKQILAQILIAKVEKIKAVYEENTTATEELINNLKADFQTNQTPQMRTKIDKLDRWLVEVKNKKRLCEDKLTVIKTSLAALKPKDTDLENRFNEARIDITQASLYLKEGVSYMKEIEEEMKYE